jgi:hypothetical protein
MDEWSLNLSGVKALFRVAECFEIEVDQLLDKLLGE